MNSKSRSIKEKRIVAIDEKPLAILRVVLELFYLCKLDKKACKMVLILLQTYAKCGEAKDGLSKDMDLSCEIFGKIQELVEKLHA